MSKLPMHIALHDSEDPYVCPMQQCKRPRVLSFTAGDDSKEEAESGGWLDDSCIHHSSI